MSIPCSSSKISSRAPALRTPLYDLHRELGAHLGPFAGYEMPIRYPLGVLREHLHTRQAAGLFDVSHMGQLALRPRGADIDGLARALERLVPVDVLGLPEGRQRYGFFTNDRGGILDDLMIGRRSDHFLLVVNASRKSTDEDHLRAQLAQSCEVVPLRDRALLALQGPAAEEVLADLAPAVVEMRFMDLRDIRIAGVACVVARSGYTGEDGFEISVPSEAAETIARQLLKNPKATLAGLGARDSLRLEAGLCLYGADLDESTTPSQAALDWAIPKVRRVGGSRAGDFLGATTILTELTDRPRRLRVGLRPQDRTPVRAGVLLFADAVQGEPVGKVTSGGYGPTVSGPVAMGYVAAAHAALNTQLFADVRGRRVAIAVTALPFVPHRYKRR
ncbi:MAG: glycine cleavage system aminomethyltransferase GcvT [Pseudolabrys sp.]|nr:glycine cleavage system aminomethyltransferase GcvT [Pseudolabrys sp.]